MPGCDGTYNGIVLEEGQEHRSDKRWNKSQNTDHTRDIEVNITSRRICP
jgi:hypothetical protein